MSTYSIHDNGYIVLQNVLNPSHIDMALTCIQEDNSVNYHIMKQFIDTCFFPTIQQNTTIIKNPMYVKFRFSNNNNSTDASTFHSDVYNHTNSELLPIYTCLCYFDDSQLEVIPGSHIASNKISCLQSYSNKIIINVNRGDILVFHANLHHRGVNFGASKDRRLLQVFEVFPDANTYNTHFNNLITVLSYNSPLMKISNYVAYMAAQIPFLINTINMFHYFLVYNDLQYKVALMDLDPWTKANKYITYEPGKRKNYNELTNNEDLNINVLCDKNSITENPSNFYFYIYLLYYIVSGIIIYYIVKKQLYKPLFKSIGLQTNKFLRKR
jgi:ectoine hydroxylase-related dioxygenase (phytanoyl-CoA dioxygenase family)